METIDKTATKEFRGKWIDFVYHLQKHICDQLENIDGKKLFGEDDWERAEGRGGGGKTRTLADGNVFEKAGVNVSVVYGKVTDGMRRQLKIEGYTWFASGLSLVIHPQNPFVPTVHANWRYFELYNEDGSVKDRWFGGGTDLTPYYLFEEDAKHFHQVLKSTLDSFGDGLYPAFKENCDAYFVNAHRNNETRGIGGVFYDHLRADEKMDNDQLLALQSANGYAFLEAYLPIVQKRKGMAYGEPQKIWQEIRRGRYVEFNLIHDRGTLFGLKTKGRIESILMSLPPRARWVYDHKPIPGSAEDALFQVCLRPVNWV